MLTNLSEKDQRLQRAPGRRLIGERAGLRLVISRREQAGVGDVITSPQSSRLSDGVEIEPAVRWPDARACFSEIFRFGAPGIARDFSCTDSRQIQVSYTVA